MSTVVAERIERFRNAVISATPRQLHRIEESDATGDSVALVLAFDCLYEEDEVGDDPAELGVDPFLVDWQVNQSPLLVALSDRLDERRRAGVAAWVSTGMAQTPPARSRFLSPHSSSILGGKPSTGGLFTSTPGVDQGMWRLYLGATAEISLFPKPWTTWLLPVAEGARTISVDTATEWCELVASNPLSTSRGSVLNWTAMSKETDGINISLRAVFSTDGLQFAHQGHTVAPVHWTTQTTVWLNWSFTDPVTTS